MKATKKIIGAAAALVLSLGIATGSTFAWFASNSKVTVDSFDVSVASGSDNLLVAVGSENLNDSDFKSNITNSAITTAIKASLGTNQSMALTALTSKLTDNDTTGTSAGITLVDKSGATASASTGAYATFTLTFRSELPLNIVLDYGSAVTASTASTVSPKSVKAWSNITLATYSTVESSDTKTELTKDTDKVVARAANASRISFVTGTDTKSSKVWSPNEHNASGVEETSATETTNGKGFWKNNLAAVYYNYMYGSSETIKQVEYKSNVAALSSSDTSAAKAANTILTLSTAVKDSTDTSKTLYYQDSVTINIWLEGTDGDCFDSIFDDAMSVALKFVGVATLAS